MKFVIASDIHGSAKYCRLLLAQFEKEHADKLLLLGDILYHGPRNDLPEEYDPRQVTAMLSEYKDKIICIRGNCEAEVDQMVLPFPVSADYAYIYADGVELCLSHGHREVPPLKDGAVYLTGHTHVPVHEDLGFLHLNPGSVSLPKDGTAHGYILFDGGEFTFKDIYGTPYDVPFIKRQT